MEFAPTNGNSFILFITTFALFVIAAIAEIGGGYLVWQWLRERKNMGFGLVDGVTLFLYGIIPTFQPSNFGRVYAAYGGIFVVMAIVWGLAIDKKRPDRYEVIGGFVVLLGASKIFCFTMYLTIVLVCVINSSCVVFFKRLLWQQSAISIGLHA